MVILTHSPSIPVTRDADPAYDPSSELYLRLRGSLSVLHTVCSSLSKRFCIVESSDVLEASMVYVPWFVTTVDAPVRAMGGCSETTANLFEKRPPESMSSPVVES